MGMVDPSALCRVSCAPSTWQLEQESGPCSKRRPWWNSSRSRIVVGSASGLRTVWHVTHAARSGRPSASVRPVGTPVSLSGIWIVIAEGALAEAAGWRSVRSGRWQARRALPSEMSRAASMSRLAQSVRIRGSVVTGGVLARVVPRSGIRLSHGGFAWVRGPLANESEGVSPAERGALRVGERGEEREREGVEAARRALVRVLRWPVGMPITALVLTLDDDPEARRAARRSLEQDARLWVGDEVGGRVPLVLETASLVEGERAVEALSASDGVLFVDVVAIDFSDTEA
jgi:hypothetical protein